MQKLVATAREVDLVIQAAQEVIRMAWLGNTEAMYAAEIRLDKLVDKIKSRADAQRRQND